MKNYLVTHTDLDGVGCEILFRKYFSDEEVEVYQCNYKNVNEKVREIIPLLCGDEPNCLMITDISVSEEVAEDLNVVYLEYNSGIMLLDHHVTALGLNKYAWCNVNDTKCGTALFFNEVIMKDRDASGLERYKIFADMVNDYDLWQHTDSRSKDLNMLYGILGREKFVKRFILDSDPNPTDIEEALIDTEKDRIQKYCDKVCKGIYEYESQYFVFAERYPSEVGHYILKKRPDIGIIQIVDLNNLTVSMRSKADFDCTVMAKQRGGGGHKNASGYPLPERLAYALLHDITYDKLINNR